MGCLPAQLKGEVRTQRAALVLWAATFDPSFSRRDAREEKRTDDDHGGVWLCPMSDVRFLCDSEVLSVRVKWIV